MLFLNRWPIEEESCAQLEQRLAVNRLQINACVRDEQPHARQRYSPNGKHVHFIHKHNDVSSVRALTTNHNMNMNQMIIRSARNSAAPIIEYNAYIQRLSFFILGVWNWLECIDRPLKFQKMRFNCLGFSECLRTAFSEPSKSHTCPTVWFRCVFNDLIDEMLSTRMWHTVRSLECRRMRASDSIRLHS